MWLGIMSLLQYASTTNNKPENPNNGGQSLSNRQSALKLCSRRLTFDLNKRNHYEMY